MSNRRFAARRLPALERSVLASTLISLALLGGCGDENGENDSPPPVPNPAALPPLRIVLFGDSIAASTLASTQRGSPLDRVFEETLGSSPDRIDPSTLNEEALSRALQALGTAPNENAIVGTRDSSHASRITASFGRRTDSKDFAVNGATSGDMAAQLDRARAELGATGAEETDYVALIVGGNDFCGRKPVDAFEADVKARLDQVARTFPNAIVNIYEVPDVVSVLTQPDGTAFTAFGREVGCVEVRRTLGLCQDRGLSPASSEADKAAARAELDQMNAAIARSVAAAQAARRTVFVSPLAHGEGSVPPDQLAADCFHPSATGHRVLADAGWTPLERALREKSAATDTFMDK